MSAYSNKSNNQRLEDIHWLLSDDRKVSWFYQRVAREVLNFKVPLAGGGTTTLATKAAWQANEFAQIKTLINRNHALLTVLASAVNALAESSNADTDEVKALISQKMDEATATLKAELDELQEVPEVEAAKAMSFEVPESEEVLDATPVAAVTPAEVPTEGPGLETESESQPDESAATPTNAAPVANV